jgi:predicted nucleic acid-binding Zn ribbon protein
MIKIGDKVLVIARIAQVVEDEDGVHYVVTPDDKKRSFFTLRIRKEDIQPSAPNE